MATPSGGAYAKASTNPKKHPYVIAVSTTEKRIAKEVKITPETMMEHPKPTVNLTPIRSSK